MPTIEEILKFAREMEASDVHLAVGTPPRARVKGKLAVMAYPNMLPGDILDILISIMPERQRLRFEEKGEYDMSFSIPRLGRYRVHAYKQRGCISMAFRMLEAEVPSPETLGIPESVLDLYRLESGLVVVTGKAGSGRSTTLAALIDMINNNRYSHIVTLENPIEYLHVHKLSMVNQREIGVDSDTYASALRAALREDPDVILVGEMRDAETISEAVTAAEMGCLVLASMHTVGAAAALEQIVDLFPPYRQMLVRARLANVLQAVVSQQRTFLPDGSASTVSFDVVLADEQVRALIRGGKQVDGGCRQDDLHKKEQASADR